MSFVPNQAGRPGGGMPAALRTVLFWLLMVVLATVLWKMSSSNRSAGSGGPPSPEMSYSDFMGQVDKDNVSSVRLLESPATSEVQGELRDSQQKFRTTIPKETIPTLTERLRKQGASVEVSEENNVGWTRLLANLAPFILILAFWVFMMGSRLRGNRPVQNPPAAPTPTVPTNRPLG